MTRMRVHPLEILIQNLPLSEVLRIAAGRAEEPITLEDPAQQFADTEPVPPTLRSRRDTLSLFFTDEPFKCER